MIRALATSLGGTEHILIGTVRDKLSVPFVDDEQARAVLTRIGWTNIRIEIDSKEMDGDTLITWDDQSVTIHGKGKGDFSYLRGGPKANR